MREVSQEGPTALPRACQLIGGFLGSLPENEFLHFARRRSRQFAEHDMPGTHEAGHLAITPLYQGIGRRRLDTLAKLHEGARGLAPMGIGLGDNCDLEYGRKAGNNFFDLKR